MSEACVAFKDTPCWRQQREPPQGRNTRAARDDGKKNDGAPRKTEDNRRRVTMRLEKTVSMETKNHHNTKDVSRGGTYRAVEDHEAVVEVVMLHGGVAVELG